MKNYEELREQIIEFRKVFNNKDKIKGRLSRIAADKCLLSEKDIISIEKMRLDLIFDIDSIKLSYGEVITAMSNDNISYESRALAQEYIMMADEAVRLSNELITIIDTIV